MAQKDDDPEKFLFYFYGEECPHCSKMEPLLEQLEKEIGKVFEKLEVWHNPANAQKMEEFQEILEEICGAFGVPAFYNIRTGEAFCGEVDYAALKEWATKEPEVPDYVT